MGKREILNNMLGAIHHYVLKIIYDSEVRKEKL